MSRAILLPTPGDPYICAGWVSSYKKYIKQHVDKLYVCLNSPAEDPIFQYVNDLFLSCEATIIHHHKFIDHGPALTELLKIVGEDHVLILEDDFYVQTPDAVQNWFHIVESGHKDMVGSMRGCVGPQIIKATARKFGLTGDEALQPNFWPSLFACRTEDLRKTDCNFRAKRYAPGVFIPELDFTPTQETGGDTFVWASIQLRALGLSVHQIKQWRLIDVIRENKIPPPWIHVGSGSTTLNGHLLDENMIPIGNKNWNKPKGFPPVPDHTIRVHFEKKFAWWSMMNKLFPVPQSSPAAYFNLQYKEAVNRSIKGCGLSRAAVSQHEGTLGNILRPIT